MRRYHDVCVRLCSHIRPRSQILLGAQIRDIIGAIPIDQVLLSVEGNFVRCDQCSEVGRVAMLLNGWTLSLNTPCTSLLPCSQGQESMLCARIGRSPRSLLFFRLHHFAPTGSIGHSLRHQITSFSACARLPLIFADIFLMTITWRKLGGESKNLRLPFAKHSRTGFSDILLENGILYFVTLFILNSLDFIFSVTSIFGEGSGTASKLTRFTDPLNAILVCRFILDLQEANEHNVKIGSDDPELQMSRISSQSSLSFVDRALGSLGSIITPGARAAVDNDYDSDEVRDGDHQPLDSSDVGGQSIALHDLMVEPEPNSEAQKILGDEPLARAV
ncbi:hypothetical protein C8Q80DRAFT_767648 [Daedaleopsis nitida]|nr:hypothetical protein C8Q80DRAFT_767648 [Daedaleopsis nitida]